MKIKKKQMRVTAQSRIMDSPTIWGKAKNDFFCRIMGAFAESLARKPMPYYDSPVTQRRLRS